MRIGLFGGTFNPIHDCHLSIVREIRSRMNLDLIVFIPTGDPPHKPPGTLAPAAHRVAMVRLAIAGNASFILSDIEVRRTDKSYSIETVRALKAEYGPDAVLYFVVGLDAFLEFPTWKDASALLRLCRFIVVSRPPHRFLDLADMSLLPGLPADSLAALDRQRRDRVDVRLPDAIELTLLALPPCPVSASEIRQRIRNRRSLSNLLPTSVESYIMRHQLYQEESDRTT